MLRSLCKLLFGRCRRVSRPAPRLVNVFKPDAVKSAVRKPTDVLKLEAVDNSEVNSKSLELPVAADIPKPDAYRSEEPKSEETKPEELKSEDLKPEEPTEESTGQDRDEKKDFHEEPDPSEKIDWDEENDLDEEPRDETMYQQIGPRATLELIEKMEPRSKSDPIEMQKLKEKLGSSEDDDLCVKIESVLTLKPSERTELREKLERFDEAERQRRLEERKKRRDYDRRVSDAIRELWYILPRSRRSGRDKASTVSDAAVYMKDLQQDLSVALTEIARLEVGKNGSEGE